MPLTSLGVRPAMISSNRTRLGCSASARATSRRLSRPAVRLPTGASRVVGEADIGQHRAGAVARRRDRSARAASRSAPRSRSRRGDDRAWGSGKVRATPARAA